MKFQNSFLNIGFFFQQVLKSFKKCYFPRQMNFLDEVLSEIFLIF